MQRPRRVARQVFRSATVTVVLTLALFLQVRTLTAQDLPIQLDVDVATFAYDASSSLVEVYLAFEASTLSFDNVDTTFIATLPVDLDMRKSSDSDVDGTVGQSVWSDSLVLSFVIPDTAGLVPGQHFVHQVRAAITPGEYELDVSVPGDTVASRQTLRLRRDVVVPGFDDGTTAISDVTLATHIAPSDDAESPFYKNGLLIRPNANQLFGEGLSRVFYYAEVYNVDAVQGLAGEYTLFSYIADANLPRPLPGNARRVERPTRSPDVVVGSFDVGALPSGSYFLRMAVLNRDNEAVVEQSRKFFVFNPSIVREQPVAVRGAFETSVYASMPEDDVVKELELIQILANDRERRRAKSIQDMDERRRFLLEFWQRRNPNPNSPANTARQEFLERVQYANDRYTNSRTEGWKTDRGRVLLKHGLPSAIDPHLYERDSVPYEIWEYHNIPGEGQAIFVFADRTGFGQFDLLHSTVTGETTLPDWQEELRRR